MIHATIRIFIPSDKREEVVGLLISFARLTRYEPGCLRCNVYLDGEIAEGILLDELWNDKPSLEVHLRSVETRVVFEAVELSIAPPEFRFETIEHLSGLEAVELASEHALRSNGPIKI
jgi:quinol monooxygenase YgiN